MTVRHMGKAGFAHLQQNGERLQIYVKKDAVGERDFQLFKMLDIGDIIGVEGYLFRTRTGELSIHAEKLEFLSKTLLSMPEKWHGLEDVETRYRQRYLDLIANPEVRKVFVTRARIISSLRRQLEARDFIEVETPMMQPLYGGLPRARSSRTTTRSISTCICASRRSCTSSGWWWAAWSACTKSIATSATKASRRITTPSSPCWSSTRPTPITSA